MQKQNQENYYKILLRLKELEYKLFDLQTFEQVDLLRYELLAFIDESISLKNIFKIKLEDFAEISGTKDYKNWIEQVRTYAEKINELNARKSKCSINYTTFKKGKMLEIIKDTGDVLNIFDVPEVCYFPSISLLMNRIINPVSSFDDLGLMSCYRNVDELGVFQTYFIQAIISNFDIEFYIITQDFFTSNKDIKEFNRLYLGSIVMRVIKLLQIEINALLKNGCEKGQTKKELTYICSSLNELYQIATPATREILNLMQTENYTTKQIAQILKKEETTIKSQFQTLKEKSGYGKREIETLILKNKS